MSESFTPLTLAQINNQTGSAVTIINTNFQTIATLLEDVLSLSGSSPNQMGSNLDMNSYTILNLADASSNASPVTLSQLNAATLGTPLTFVIPANTLTGTTLASNVITSSLTTVGTIGTGVWHGSVLAGQYGGTGVANTGFTITLAGNLITTGAFNTTFTAQATGTFTLPSLSATLAGLERNQTWTGQQIFADTKLNLAGSSSGATTLKASAAAGSTVITFPAVTDTVVTLVAMQTLTNKSLTATQVSGVGQQTIVLKAVNFNSANTDNPITITLPSGSTFYQVASVRISNATHSLTTATFGIFTATAAGGTTVVTTGTVISVSTASDGTNNNSQQIAATNTGTQAYSLAGFPTLYFRVQTAEGAVATADVTLTIVPL